MQQKNIWVAAGDGDLTRVIELVECDGLSANMPDEYTYTPMHAAASYGRIEILVYLISKGGDVNITDDEGDTPLYTVEDVETAKFLVRQGAVVDHTNNEGISPIEHLREEFPHVAAYLETLSSGQVNSAAHTSTPISQHSQNAVSEDLTNDLMARISGLAETDEEGLQREVTESVMASLARGQELHGETTSIETETGGEKRARLS